MKRRLLCTYDGEGTELCKTVKRLIRNQSIKNNFVHSRSQTQLRLQFQVYSFLEFYFSNISIFSSSPSIQRNFDRRHFQPSLTCISFSLLVMMSTFTSALLKTKSPSGSKQLKRTTQTFS